MCGIAGHLSFTSPPDPAGVRKMVAGISHRGPDDSGLWVAGRGNCILGHARLSIIDLSPLGHQPMLDPETGNTIVFNGEIYNFQSLRKECEAAGDSFRSHSDTEVILALYRRHGIECLKKLRGMFAFALWDEAAQHLFMARDRVGKKPLNYALMPDGIAFCSELLPLSRLPGVVRDLDSEALDLYLQLQYVPAPWTIYRGIRKLPAAHYCLMNSSGIRIERYWNVDYRQTDAISDRDALDGLEEKLSEAIRLRMIADVPLGALLSGGVDSSVVVALMAKLSGEPIRTYSIGFKEEAYNELPYAQQAAGVCGTLHQPEVVEGDVEHLLPTLARHYGEPYADSSAVPSFFVCQTARRHVTVAMNGDGGDELLGGYSRYSLSPLQMRVSGAFPDLLSARSLTALSARLATVAHLPGKVARKLVTEFAWPEMRSLVMYSSFWNDADRARLMARPDESTVLQEWRAHFFGEARAHADTAIERMLWYDNRTYLEGDLLVKMDIASMHCGLETRSPLLDHEVIEYCAKLPVELKVRQGVGKYLLKKLAERYFPADFVHRPKMGFGIPLADWLRGPLRPTLETLVRDPIAMEPLDSAFAATILDEFLNQGRDHHSSRLWALLMFGMWRQSASANA